MPVSDQTILRARAYMARGITKAAPMRDAFAADGQSISLQCCYEAIRAVRAKPMGAVEGKATVKSVVRATSAIKSALELSGVFSAHTVAALDQLGIIAGDIGQEGIVRQRAAAARAELSILAQGAIRDGLLIAEAVGGQPVEPLGDGA